MIRPRCASNNNNISRFADSCIVLFCLFVLLFAFVTGWRCRDCRGSSGPDRPRHYCGNPRVFRHLPVDEADRDLRQRVRRRGQGMIEQPRRAWYGEVWCGSGWYGSVWLFMVRDGSVLCGMVGTAIT